MGSLSSRCHQAVNKLVGILNNFDATARRLGKSFSTIRSYVRNCYGELPRMVSSDDVQISPARKLTSVSRGLNCPDRIALGNLCRLPLQRLVHDSSNPPHWARTGLSVFSIDFPRQYFPNHDPRATRVLACSQNTLGGIQLAVHMQAVGRATEGTCPSQVPALTISQGG